jgi:hypothetical protein
MPDKQRFSFLIRSEERLALKQIATLTDRSEGGTIRLLIRQEIKRAVSDSDTKGKMR